MAGTAHAAATSGVRKPSGMCMAALRAVGDDREVDELRLVAAGLAEDGRDSLDRVDLERPVGAAALARDVARLVVSRERVQPGAVRDVEVPDEADLLERVEVAVDGREVRAREAPVEAGGDRVGGNGSLGGEQRLEHGPAGGPGG